VFDLYLTAIQQYKKIKNGNYCSFLKIILFFMAELFAEKANNT